MLFERLRNRGSLELVDKLFDIFLFLAHSSVDKPRIRELYERLKQQGIQPWLDEEELIGGSLVGGLQKAILESRTAAICIGSTELSAWQKLEFETILRECMEGQMSIIPVLLPGVSSIPSGLPFLRTFVWVSFQYGLDDRQAMTKLVQSIKSTAERSSIAPSPSSVIDRDRQWFVNVGENRGHLRWEDCQRYGCISAGGGPTYGDALQRLNLGDTVYAYVSGAGYIGAGKVVKTAVPIHKFTTQDGKPLLKKDLATKKVNNLPDNPDFTDWVAGINWIKTFDREQASRDTEHYRATLCEIQNADRLASLHKTFST